MADALTDKIAAMIKASGGYIKIDPANPDHADLLNINVPQRSVLARDHQIVIHYDPVTRKPDELYFKTRIPTAAPVKPVVPTTPVGAPAPVVKKDSVAHTFYKPPFFDEVVAMFGAARNPMKEKAANILFVGPKGSGKTETVELIGKTCGFSRVYQINGYAEMPASSFLGDKTVAIDEKSMQSFVTYQQGVLEKALTHGLEMNADGHAVLDENGDVKVIGAPALLFIDEFAGLDERVAFVLNRAFQIPREPGKSRVIELDTDGGRMVKGHPGMCVVLAGNVIGRGHASEIEEGYTAQSGQQDLSFLDRISATFYFGYNLEAERNIVMNKLQDDALASKVLQFRDAIRNAYCARTVETLLSTRLLISLCDNVRVLKAAGFSDSAPRAIYRTLFCGLVDTEKQAWKEAVRLTWGIDVIDKYENASKLWVPKFTK